MATRKTPGKSPKPPKTAPELQPDARLIPDEHHPDHVGGQVQDPYGDAPDVGTAALPLQRPPAGPVGIFLCPPVSGRYRLVAPNTIPVTNPIPPIQMISVTVRVDVDRYFPQHRISLEVNRRFPRASAHVIAEVSSDTCLRTAHRRIIAQVTYRDGDNSLIPGDTLEFVATRGRTGLSYGSYTLTLSGGAAASRSYALSLVSRHFDPVEFEVDRTSNAGVPVTTFDTASHANRPATLPAEVLSLASVYQRAGFDVSMSPGTSVIPAADAGANGTWSDGEMHNAMVTYWSRFADRPQWALWVLYAARHDEGRSLGGVMFDDIGPNHRQGTAIFTDSFIQDAPAGDPQAAAWRNRMQFWTAVHEMGHAFNLAHAWQKALGAPVGNPWVPLVNEPESRSFMNYPFRVAGGQSRFFSDFAFRFSDDELVFMRHAPRRYVQMGNSGWFVNHGLQEDAPGDTPGGWRLQIRPNRNANTYQFMEPVVMELKLTNGSDVPQPIDAHLLQDGRHLALLVQRDGAPVRPWRSMVGYCHEAHTHTLPPGQSLYGAHAISMSTSGWLIDEPGFYRVQAAVTLGGEVLLSNVLRFYVAAAATGAQSTLAPDYFTEDVARALTFRGAPALAAAQDTLKLVCERCSGSAAAVHAQLALSTPQLRPYKRLELGAGGERLAIRTTPARLDAALKAQSAALLDGADAAAVTLGHVAYFSALDGLAAALSEDGAARDARKVLKASVASMKSRAILPAVIQKTERQLAALG